MDASITGSMVGPQVEDDTGMFGDLGNRAKRRKMEMKDQKGKQAVVN